MVAAAGAGSLVPGSAWAYRGYVATAGAVPDGDMIAFMGPFPRGHVLIDERVAVPLAGARDLAVTPDGRTVYAVAGESLVAVDTWTGAKGTPLPVGAGAGSQAAVTPDGTTVLVTSPATGRVTPVDTATGVARTPIAVPRPTGIAVAPDGRTAWVLTGDGATLTPVDLATGATGTPVVLARPGAAVAVTPDGSLALVPEADGQGTTTPGPGAVQVVGLATRTAETPVPLGATGATALAVTPDGKTAYVATGGAGAATTVVAFDVATRATGATYAIRPATAGADASIQDLVADFTRSQVFGTIPCATGGCGAAAFAYTFDVGFNPSPEPTTGGPRLTTLAFGSAPSAGVGPVSSLVIAPSPGVTFRDTTTGASISDLSHRFFADATDDDGGIVTGYVWDFGDGSPLVTAGAPDHRFAAYGTYHVTLTTTNSGGCAAHLVYTGQTAACTGRATATAARDVVIAPEPSAVASTGAATGVSQHGATLAGSIAMIGASVSWHFEYGRTIRYGHALPAQEHADAFGAQPVTQTLTDLRPKTLYHYRLVTQKGQRHSEGADATFTTAATGTLALRARTLTVTGTRVRVPLRCESLVTCRGRLAVTTKVRDAHRRIVTVTCGRTTMSLKAGRTGAALVPLSARCRSRLRHAAGARLAARATSVVTTGQRDIAAAVRLRR